MQRSSRPSLPRSASSPRHPVRAGTIAGTLTLAWLALVLGLDLGRPGRATAQGFLASASSQTSIDLGPCAEGQQKTDAEGGPGALEATTAVTDGGTRCGDTVWPGTPVAADAGAFVLIPAGRLGVRAHAKGAGAVALSEAEMATRLRVDGPWGNSSSVTVWVKVVITGRFLPAYDPVATAGRLCLEIYAGLPDPPSCVTLTGTGHLELLRIEVPRADPFIQLKVNLWAFVITAAPWEDRTVNLSRTAQVVLELPPGFTFTDDSGQFLSTAPTVTVSPPSGTAYHPAQGFDLTILAGGPGLGIDHVVTATLDGVDVAAALAGCAISGHLAAGGTTLRCPGLTFGLLGPGRHAFEVELALTGGTTATGSAVWEVTDAFPSGEPFEVSPPSGTFTPPERFDLVLMFAEAAGAITGGRATLDGTDVTSALLACLRGIPLTGGVAIRCPGLSGALLGPGTHEFSVTAEFAAGPPATRRATWDVRAATER